MVLFLASDAAPGSPARPIRSTAASPLPSEVRMNDETPKVLTERRGPLLIVTINRPQVKNACDAETAAQMNVAMDLLDDDESLFIGILTGSDGNFSTGADLKAVARGERATTDGRGGSGCSAAAAQAADCGGGRLCGGRRAGALPVLRPDRGRAQCPHGPAGSAPQRGSGRRRPVPAAAPHSLPHRDGAGALRRDPRRRLLPSARTRQPPGGAGHRAAGSHHARRGFAGQRAARHGREQGNHAPQRRLDRRGGLAKQAPIAARAWIPKTGAKAWLLSRQSASRNGGADEYRHRNRRAGAAVAAPAPAADRRAHAAHQRSGAGDRCLPQRRGRGVPDRQRAHGGGTRSVADDYPRRPR